MTRHELRTPRLSLRAWRDSDREPFAAMNTDDEVMRWFPPHARRRESSDATVDRFLAEHDRVGYTCWVVEVVGSEPCPAEPDPAEPDPGTELNPGIELSPDTHLDPDR